jgi:hypothetical protein
MGRDLLFAVSLALAASFLSAGCSNIQLIPKKKEEARTTRYYKVRKYDIKPSIDLYTKRYTYWKTWHRELLEVLADGNFKKPEEAIDQAISNLWDMQRMLVDEKAAALGKYLDEMIQIQDTMKKEKITAGNETRIRRKLESLEREIKRGFSYNKMGGSIRNEFAKTPAN